MTILNKLQRLLLKRIHPEDLVELKSGRIYILPTREGIFFALLVLIMLAAAINFNNSLIFFFTFLIASVAVISMYMTQQNLIGLRFSTGHISPVFQFQNLQIPLQISADKIHYSIAINFQEDNNLLYTDVRARETSEVLLSSSTQQRGHYKLMPIVISTRFPLGLFRAWANIELNNDAVIYPAPQAIQHFSPRHGHDSEGSNPNGKGMEDFSGFKNYQMGEPLTHIHWKAYAREQGLLSKTFSGSSHKEYWLNWTEVSGTVEQRLAKLCRLVIDAHQRGDRYGLILPTKTIPVSSGQKHYCTCLESLALF